MFGNFVAEILWIVVLLSAPFVISLLINLYVGFSVGMEKHQSYLHSGLLVVGYKMLQAIVEKNLQTLFFVFGPQV